MGVVEVELSSLGLPLRKYHPYPTPGANFQARGLRDAKEANSPVNWGWGGSRGERWGVSEVRGKKYWKMGSEGDARGIGAAARKRKRYTNITQRQFGKRNLFYSSLHSAIYEGGYLLIPYISYTKMPPQICSVMRPTSVLENLQLMGWAESCLRKVF